MAADYFRLVRQNDPDIASILAQAEDVNVRKSEGENLLHVAIAFHNKNAALELIRLGIDVNAQTRTGDTPLHYAADWNEIDVADEILKHHGDISLVDRHGNTPLWTAVTNARGDYRFVELLVRHGAAQFAHTKNEYQKSPMEAAVK